MVGALDQSAGRILVGLYSVLILYLVAAKKSLGVPKAILSPVTFLDMPNARNGKSENYTSPH